MKSKEMKRSTGKRREARAGKNCARTGKPLLDLVGEEQVRQEANRRWPTKEQEQVYAELNMAKKQRGRPAKRIKPPAFGFALLESIPAAQLDRMLTCASLKYKKVKRFPGWILQRTYNLKGRPIDFS